MKDIPKSDMFKQSKIGTKCSCDAPETVCKEHAWKRYRLPKGHFEDGYYFDGGYYIVGWWSLHCEVCGNKREDFIVYKWGSNGDWTFIDGPMPRADRPRRYPEVYKWIRQLMPN